MNQMKTEYLGDGLYVRCDGYQVYLMANSHTDPTDTVALDSHVLASFLRWVERMRNTEEDEE